MARKPEGELRRGWTTGACAAAGARAACAALMTGRFPDPVTIRLPGGQTPSFRLARKVAADGGATAGIVKDAGDDPDITHGALVLTTLRPGPPGAGIVFRAGDGVGTVTLPGLALAVGEPAINPGPRGMIRTALAAAIADGGPNEETLAAAIADGGPNEETLAAAPATGGPNEETLAAAPADGGPTGTALAASQEPDLEVTVAIPGGEELASRTMNPRLGIIGGLSILGTTGVVIPYSCASWIHAIHRGIDVARAAGLDHLSGATGRTSEAAAQRHHNLPDAALIDMGDFAGGMLKYLRDHPVPRLTIAGGFAKLTKLAAGHLDLHSSRSTVDIAGLADMLAGLGAGADQMAAARQARAAGALLEIARQTDLPLAALVARRAREVALATLAGGTAVDVLVFDRRGRIVGRAGP